MSRNLNRIVYDAVLLDKLTNAGLIRVSDYYESSVITLMTKCQLNRVDIEKINQLIADKVAPAPMNALQIQLSHQKSGSEDVLVASSSSGVVSSSGSNQYVSTGSTGLDTLLGGGLSQIGITEVVGSPGMGKSLFNY